MMADINRSVVAKIKYQGGPRLKLDRHVPRNSQQRRAKVRSEGHHFEMAAVPIEFFDIGARRWCMSGGIDLIMRFEVST